MAKEKENIVVKSDSLSEGDLKLARGKVKRWLTKGYKKMAIMNFLYEEGRSVSGYLENGNFVINLA